MSEVVPSSVGVHVQAAGVCGDFSLALSDADVTVAEVLDALGLADEQIAIDGVLVTAPAATAAIEVLRSGSCIGSAAAMGRRQSADCAAATIELSQVAGLDAGSTSQVARGLYRVGVVSTKADSGWYLEIDRQPQLTDEARPWHEHGTSIESLPTATGAFAVSRPIDPEPGDARQVIRPPRRVPPVDVVPIDIIDAPAPVQPRASLSWATLLAPIPIALAMAFFFRPIFALFAAMGPVMAVFRWYESKRRYRRDLKRRNGEIAAMVSQLESAALEQAEQMARLRWLSHPHVAELWKRARMRSVRLWERRPGSLGFLEVSVGVGADQVDAMTAGAKLDEEVHGRLCRPLQIRPVPHTVSLDTDSGIGVYGTRPEARAVARSLVLQLATLQGPADLRIGVICAAAHADHWDWIKWLPHTDPALVGSNSAAVARHLIGQAQPDRAAPFGSNEPAGPTSLLLVDDQHADIAAITRAAQQSRQGVRIVAVASHPTMLPAACSSLVHVHGTTAELTSPALNSRRAVVRSIGLSLATATSWARSLGALGDPEAERTPLARPVDVSLSTLLGVSSGGDIMAQWAIRPAAAPPIVPIGVSDDGPFVIDLTTDGPHALIAGTTGSGKSELLRTIVAGLAAMCPPDQLNLVLIDFKGGGAFDAVSELPHVAGLLTDLDEGLVRRAVTSLRAELERREQLFRSLGVSAYQQAVAVAIEPLPRLLVAVDEFAALAASYPEELAAIVDLAARGRSLGMHLLLATQRPSGVVDQKIRANTNLRIALRVQEAFDSHDVVGTNEAATFDSTRPGAAIVRIGNDLALRVQTAFSGRPIADAERCAVRPHALFAAPGPSKTASSADETELDSLVAAISSAGKSWAGSARPLWLPPLPSTLSFDDLRAAEEWSPELGDSSQVGVALGLVDQPVQRRQGQWCWELDRGPLAIYGGSAKCAARTLVAIGAAVASLPDQAPAHVYVIDGDSGSTASLKKLAHVGAFVSLEENDRIERTLRLFEDAITERRKGRDLPLDQRLVLLIDNLAAIVATYDDLGASELVKRLGALARDGSSLGLHLVVTARTARDIGHRLAEHIPQRLVLALADPNGYLTLGMRPRDVVDLPEMRAIDVSSKQVVQLASPPDLSAGVGMPLPTMPPTRIESFPESVRRDQIVRAEVLDSTIHIPIGIEAEDLEPAILRLRPREHALIASANAMGRSSLVCTILRQLADAADTIRLARICLPHSPVADNSVPGELLPNAAAIEQFALERDVPAVLAVDDPEWLDDETTNAIHAAMKSDCDIRVIVATTSSYARSPRPWMHDIRRSQSGVLLGLHHSEGELFKVRLRPAACVGVLPGRGYLVVHGRAQAVQVAHDG